MKISITLVVVGLDISAFNIEKIDDQIGQPNLKIQKNVQ